MADSTGRGRRSREIATRVATVLLSIVATVVLVEVFLQVQDPYLRLMGDRAEWLLGRYRAHRVWHHWMRPNSLALRETFDPKAYPELVVYRTNPQGCRGERDMDDALPAGTRRVIVMGDSFTEGYYEEGSFAGILDKRLNALPGGVRYQVINCGNSSYSPMLHYLRFKHQLLAYRPEELIVNIDLTDIFDDNWRYRPQATFTPEGEPLEARPSARGARIILDNLRFRFHVVRLLTGRPNTQVLAPMVDGVFAYHTTMPVESEGWQKDVAYSLSLLQRLIDLTKKENIRLTLTLYPYEGQFKPDKKGILWNRAFEEKVRDLALRNGIGFYSAYDALKPFYDRGFPLYWKDDIHFSPDGQVAWGNAFADYFTSRVD
jgi:lysophospholipase L1-like esterase